MLCMYDVVSIAELKTEEQVKQGQQFYEKLGTDAVDKGYGATSWKLYNCIP